MAAEALGGSLNLPSALSAALMAWDRDPDTRLVMRTEAVATLLEACAEKVAKKDEALVEATGLLKATELDRADESKRRAKAEGVAAKA